MGMTIAEKIIAAAAGVDSVNREISIQLNLIVS